MGGRIGPAASSNVTEPYAPSNLAGDEPPSCNARVVTFFVPITIFDKLTAEQQAASLERANEIVDELQTVIDGSRARLVDVANLDGARRMTAATFLVCANDLLREVRSASDELRLQILGVRSVVELIVVGRYLLVGRDAADEFQRRLNDSLEKDERAARDAGVPFAGAPEFLSTLVDPDARPPRSISALAEQLDAIDGREPEDGYSIVACYRLLHRHVSNSGSHASVSSIKRYTKRDGDILMIDPDGEPVFSRPPVLIVASLLRDLAADVFEALGLSLADLPADLHRPAPR